MPLVQPTSVTKNGKKVDLVVDRSLTTVPDFILGLCVCGLKHRLKSLGTLLLDMLVASSCVATTFSARLVSSSLSYHIFGSTFCDMYCASSYLFYIGSSLRC